jgi:hypothetical protein
MSIKVICSSAGLSGLGKVRSADRASAPSRPGSLEMFCRDQNSYYPTTEKF